MKLSTSSPFTTGFSSNPDYDYEIRDVLGGAVAGAADPGEVLAATAGIHGNDHEGWFTAWSELAERTSRHARSTADAGHRISAAEAFLRASRYFAVAVNAVAALKDSGQLLPTFQRQRECWDAFVDHTDTRVERVEIPYETSALAGYFFWAGTAEAILNPTLVAVNGSDGSPAGLWSNCVFAALRRGYNVLVFDGPGQQLEFFEKNVPFRPDWENVLTPVFDFVITLPGVDDEKVAVYGVSQGGYWVPRALATEHRFVAAIADPGVVDVSTSWTAQIPKHLTKLLDAGEREKFDKEMDIGMRLSSKTARTWEFRARPYGATGYADTIDCVRRFTLGNVASSITTPLLITDPENEQFWPGQSEALAGLTSEVSTLLRFTAAEGANLHCQPLARGLSAQRIFDWLDDRVGR